MQGDGTASIFSCEAPDENIFTMSMHCESNFPFKKAVSHLDVPLPDHVKDREVADVYFDAVFSCPQEESFGHSWLTAVCYVLPLAVPGAACGALDQVCSSAVPASSAACGPCRHPAQHRAAVLQPMPAVLPAGRAAREWVCGSPARRQAGQQTHTRSHTRSAGRRRCGPDAVQRGRSAV